MNIHATLAERGKNYGSFEDRCRVEQIIKRSFASGHQWDSMPDDCKSALEMIATKVSRIVAGNNPEHHDSWVDISGYATLVADRLASVDTHPKDGDSTQIEAPLVSGAVAKPDAQKDAQ